MAGAPKLIDAMRIALLNPTFWPEVRRGSERLIRDLADGFVAAGHRPRLVVGHGGRQTVTNEGGVEVVRTRRLGDRLAARAGYYESLGHAPFQYGVLRRGSDDLAHAFYVSDANAALHWSRRRRRPSVFSVMGVARPAEIRARRGRRALWRRALSRCDAVLALSDTAAAPLRELGVSPRVIHPGVDLTSFTPGGDRDPEPLVLCASDAADPRKRVDLLVEAHAKIRRSEPTARLLISRPRDAALARRLAGNPGVELVDLDDRGELVRHYRRAWVTALPAWGEAFGLVAAESLACGTPAVGAENGGVTEILGDQPVGQLFEGGAADLAAAIVKAFELASDPATPSRCRRQAERFAIDRCVHEHLALYEELLSGR